MAELTTAEKDLMWNNMDKHLAYLEGTSEDGVSHADSLHYVAEMLNGWNYIGERDTTKYTAVLTNTTRLDKEAQEVSNQEAKQYLASTDWQLLRELDGGVAMTAEIKQLRADARAKVV
jgi:hypothetical protein